MELSDDELIADRYRITGPVGANTYDAIDERFHRTVRLSFDDAPVDETTRILDGGTHAGEAFRVLAVFEEPSVVEEATAALPVVEAEPTTAQPMVTTTREGPPRSFVPIAAAVLLAVLAIGAIAIALGQRDSKTSPPDAATTTTQGTTATTARTRATTRATQPVTTEPPVTEPLTTEPSSPATTDAPPTTAAPPVTAADTPTSAAP